ncbi:MAG: M15 family metallopeptidase [Solirubrobacterales bacterium]|nr:M15 family metallopeptidase [Solirubrobacterales bacterium]
MRQLLVLPAVVVALAPFHSVTQPLSGAPRAEVKRSAWHQGCPVALSDLRVLTVSYVGFDGTAHTGQLVVNRSAAAPLAEVFRELYRLRFHIRHMSLGDAYGPVRLHPADGDVSSAFDCRQAVPSPCVGGSGTGTWSEHAFGQAVDLNPVENPYVGCGQTRSPSSRPYFNRSWHRPGMVTLAVVRAFQSVGWGWGGSWSGSTKDYMHFSATGH